MQGRSEFKVSGWKFKVCPSMYKGYSDLAGTKIIYLENPEKVNELKLLLKKYKSQVFSKPKD